MLINSSWFPQFPQKPQSRSVLLMKKQNNVLQWYRPFLIIPPFGAVLYQRRCPKGEGPHFLPCRGLVIDKYKTPSRMPSHWKKNPKSLCCLLCRVGDAPKCSSSSCRFSWHPFGQSAQDQEVSLFSFTARDHLKKLPVFIFSSYI